VQKPRPEIVIGGTGPRRTPLMAAKYADEFNSGGGEGTADRIANVRGVCEEIGRDPATLRMSVTTQVICGSTLARAQARLERLGEPGRRMLSRGTVGDVPTVVSALQELEAAGAEIAYLHIFDIDDLDHLRLIGAEVLPQVA
jgi:alkanesulfonate monooxygenase SsuD/methylene tetrahydromethanopterin reductase-like flavin-dependent oxidoreductase (luciferase family)